MFSSCLPITGEYVSEDRIRSVRLTVKSIVCVLCYAELLQSCPTLCEPMDCHSPGSSDHGIFQARLLDWVAMPSSRGSSRPRDPTQTEPDDFNVTVVATNVSLIFDLALDFIGSKLS